MKEMEHFMRIANARLRSIYTFKPQRLAMAAKMYVEWKKKNKSEQQEEQRFK
jgi:hypothetical protein